MFDVHPPSFLQCSTLDVGRSMFVLPSSLRPVVRSFLGPRSIGEVGGEERRSMFDVRDSSSMDQSVSGGWTMSHGET